MLGSLIYKWRLRGYLKQGLQVAPDCRMVSIPDFGSEPYLISIGKHVTLASNVTFITHDGGTWVIRDQARFKEIIRYGRITIHDNCFIGKGAFLMPGVSVGPNAVVASGSIVTKDVPPNSVAAGVPARVIRSIDSYAENLLAANPPYDREAYRRDKVRELLRLFPRPW